MYPRPLGGGIILRYILGGRIKVIIEAISLAGLVGREWVVKLEHADWLLGGLNFEEQKGPP